MKLIMENWREYVNEQSANLAKAQQQPTRPATPQTTPEVTQVQTFGDLKKVIQKTIEIKKAVEMGEIAKDNGADLLKATINSLTGGLTGTVTNIFNAVIAARDLGKLALAAKLPDEATENSPYLDVFNIDDEYSKIIDDRIESSFMNHLSKRLSNVPDETPITGFDVNKMLQDYLKRSYAGRTIGGGDTAKTASTIQKGASKQKAVKKIAGLAKDTVKATAVAENKKE